MLARDAVSHDAAVEGACAHLSRYGYCIIDDAVPVAHVKQIDKALLARFARTPFCEGAFYGSRTKRFGSLLNHAPDVAALVGHRLVLDVARKVLEPWCDRIILNLTQGIEIHPGALAQYPHRDQDMWQGPKGEIEYLLNVMWPLSPFTAENGATMLWPGSHRDRPTSSDRGAMAMEMDPGAVLLFLGSTLHCGGANRSTLPRRGIIVSYCLGWLRSYENQYLAYPPGVARHFDPELASLIGYAQHRPNLGNVEGRCPSILLRDDVPEHLSARDALLPAQTEALELYVRSQMGELG